MGVTCIQRIAVAASAALVSASPALAGYAASAIVSGLNNPRGLAFGGDGALYIAESGFLDPAGTGPTVDIRGATYRFGETGSITRFAGGSQSRIVVGLPSLSAIVTGETAGPQDIAFGADGTGYVVIGLGADPAVRAGALGSAPAALNLGRVMSFTGGSPASIADISAYEGANNPAGGPVDSNPYHMARLSDGFLVTDAGANALLRAGDDGSVALVATFPGRDIGGGFPSDSVSTGVVVGPDGSYYVAELTGFPFTPGAAQVYRVTPGGDVSVFGTGFTNITDLAFGADGNLYVLELDADGLLGPGTGGALVRLAADGTRSTIFSRGLVTPTGLAIGDDGDFYIANFSAAAGRGEVLRISLVPEPESWVMLIAGFGLVGAAARRRRGFTLAAPRA
ncbi:ScyD/ScyE family protein [Sandarakinorhabdus sp. DWP1-3-1]|uniref:ScyD/ScyE family protein n=1 Tax=Sandarakinorhabdus sp. DWP1-3-1 TaxID=2804627 RepID=UPI003CEC3D18